jgi:dTDP-glucose pyrophosphorylase
MKVLVLAAGLDDVTTPNRAYPVALTEFDGHPLIELTLRSCAQLGDADIIVAVRESESVRSHLDDIIRLIDPEIRVMRVRGATRGAACTALLAIDQINTDDELLVLNANEILDGDFDSIVREFRDQDVSAGVVAFPAIHPRYSYVRIDENNRVIEAAEKRPISRTATAGFYWFRHGTDFVSAAMRMIEKDAAVDGDFYVCPVLNEFVLLDQPIAVHSIAAATYHPLKDDSQIRRYEITAERKN